MAKLVAKKGKEQTIINQPIISDCLLTSTHHDPKLASSFNSVRIVDRPIDFVSIVYHDEIRLLIKQEAK